MKENKSHPKLEKRLGRCKPLEEEETFFSAVKQPTVTPLTLKPVGQEPMGTGLWGAWEEGRECSLQPTVLSGRDFVPHAMFGTETFLVVIIKGLDGDFPGIWWVEAVGTVKHHVHGRHMLQQRSPSPLGDQWW